MTADMTAGLRTTIEIDAVPADVFCALTTLGGLAAWWTPTVTGSAEPGGQIHFHFGDETVTMQVARTRSVDLVEWTCVAHTKFPEWKDTSVVFRLSQLRDGATTLRFEHAGLLPACDCYQMCSNGWDHYLRSLGAHASGRPGSPWQPSFSSAAPGARQS
jgi:uncharacterized protein YndB with AHSA1/START domain